MSICTMVVSPDEVPKESPKEQASLPVLSRDQILNVNDNAVVPVDVAAWGGRIFIKSMTGKQRDKFDQRCIKKDYDNIRAYLICLTACDEGGNLLFKPEDADKLGDKSADILNQLFDHAMKVNGIGQDEVDELKKS